MEQIAFDREKKYIAYSLSGNSDQEVLGQMATALFKEGYVTEDYEEAIKKREREFPTGLPTGEICVAIPHTDPEYVNNPAVCLGILEKPVQFHVMGMEDETVDVEILFMLAIKQKEEQLGLLQKLIATCQDQEMLSIIKKGDKDKINKVLKDLIN
ncbi:MAG: PTS sugar transporter subunit IIA [Anaerostipes sp.]|nr:PTS sugar transporter subunit IIA [Anaerostipes sp.]